MGSVISRQVDLGWKRNVAELARRSKPVYLSDGLYSVDEDELSPFFSKLLWVILSVTAGEMQTRYLLTSHGSQLFKQ